MGALSRVAMQLEIPIMTLSRWAKGTQNPPPNELVNVKKADIADLLEQEIYAILDVLPEKRNRASYSQLVIGAGTFIDKVRLLRGLPTEIIQVLPDLITAMEQRGMNASEVFHTMLLRLQSQSVDQPKLLK